MRPVTTSNRTKALQKSVGRRRAVGGGLCWSSGKGASMLRLRQSWLRKAVPQECRGMRLGRSKFGSRCQHWTASHRCLCFYAEGNEREMVPARFLIPRDVSPWKLPLRDTLWEEQKISPLCAPGILQIAVSMLSTSRLFTCLLSRNRAMSSGFYAS